MAKSEVLSKDQKAVDLGVASQVDPAPFDRGETQYEDNSTYMHPLTRGQALGKDIKKYLKDQKEGDKKAREAGAKVEAPDPEDLLPDAVKEAREEGIKVNKGEAAKLGRASAAAPAQGNQNQPVKARPERVSGRSAKGAKGAKVSKPTSAKETKTPETKEV